MESIYLGYTNDGTSPPIPMPSYMHDLVFLKYLILLSDIVYRCTHMIWNS